MPPLKIAKIVCAILMTILFGLMIRTMSGWNEARGVVDDLCYLRQAHLFQRFGLNGLDTDIARDTDGFFAARLRTIDYPKPDDPTAAPCHNRMAATGRIVMQYPPGTGFLMAAFPEGSQAVALYMVVTAMLFAVALATIVIAATPGALAASAGLGALSLYLMNNPMKSSYSLPPTMIVCVVAGALIARLAVTKNTRRRVLLAGLLGMAFGLGVDIRIANVVLVAGIGVYLLVCFIRQPQVTSLIDGVVFGLAALVGMIPTLVANAINAGSLFATTYSNQDLQPPNFAPGALMAQMGDYLKGTQGVLIVAAIVLTAVTCLRPGASRQAGYIAAGTLAVNLGYFISHTIYTPYYAVPAAMLTLWIVFFAFLYETGAIDRVAARC